MSGWTTPADLRPRAALDIDRAAAVEEALEVAALWAARQVTTADALAYILGTPKLMGDAFRHAWDDSRRPALERLHAIEYGQRYAMVHTDFGWLPRTQFDQVQRHMRSPEIGALRYRRAA